MKSMHIYIICLVIAFGGGMLTYMSYVSSLQNVTTHETYLLSTEDVLKHKYTKLLSNCSNNKIILNELTKKQNDIDALLKVYRSYITEIKLLSVIQLWMWISVTILLLFIIKKIEK